MHTPGGIQTGVDENDLAHFFSRSLTALISLWMILNNSIAERTHDVPHWSLTSTQYSTDTNQVLFSQEVKSGK